MTLSLIAAFVVSLALTRILIAMSPRWGLVDHPNERSLHVAPVATVGGVGILVATLIGLITSGADGSLAFALAGTGLLLFVLVRDEWKPLGWGQKLVVQSAAAIVLCWLASLRLPNETIAGIGVAVVFIVTLQNLYNFMDGMDGLSGLIGVVASLFLYTIHRESSPDLAAMSAVVCVSCVGFVIWNLPPARIFMGDVGSHFLGLFFGWVAIAGDAVGVPFYVSLMPIGAFLFDACYTLVRRALRGENLTQAHRFHLYQRLRLAGWSAARIDTIYIVWSVVFGAAGVALASDAWSRECLAAALVVTVGITCLTEQRWRQMGEV